MVRYNKRGMVHCIYQGVSGYIFYKYCMFCCKIFKDYPQIVALQNIDYKWTLVIRS